MQRRYGMWQGTKEPRSRPPRPAPGPRCQQTRHPPRSSPAEAVPQPGPPGAAPAACRRRHTALCMHRRRSSRARLDLPARGLLHGRLEGRGRP